MAYRDNWDKYIRDSGAQGVDDDIAVHFSSIKNRLIDFIEEEEDCCILGCVAWLTDYEILEALVAQKTVSIIVNKSAEWKKPKSKKLRGLYEELNASPLTSDMMDGLDFLMKDGSSSFPIDGIRCVGHVTAPVKSQSIPLMHHKFLVRCKLQEQHPIDGGRTPERAIVPIAQAVWTGSFNFSVNASTSLENAIEICRPSTANRFLDVWQRVYALSEPLNWIHEYSKPELAFDLPEGIYDD